MPALQVDPTDLIQCAVRHENTAETCASARNEHPGILAAAHSCGPMFAAFRAATVNAVNEREASLTAQEQWHRDTAARLRTIAAQMEQMNEQNRSALSAISADPTDSPGWYDEDYANGVAEIDPDWFDRG